jgi:predicted Zn-dependent protease
VTGTPASLLREAPPIVQPFQASRESLSPTVGVMLGAIRASEGNDRDAIVAWDNSIANGADTAVIWPLMIDAWLRQGDTARAIELARRGLAATPEHPRFTRQLATAYLSSKQPDAALQLLDAHLTRHPGDVDAQWLVLHALFAGYVEGTGPGATESGRARIGELAARYAAANGPHATLARDWAAAVR